MCPFIHAFKPWSYCPGSSLSTPLTSSWHFSAISITFFYFCSHFPLYLLLYPRELCIHDVEISTWHISSFLYIFPHVSYSALSFFIKCPFTLLALKWTFSMAHIPSQLCFPDSCEDTSHTEPWRCDIGSLNNFQSFWKVVPDFSYLFRIHLHTDFWEWSNTW